MVFVRKVLILSITFLYFLLRKMGSPTQHTVHRKEKVKLDETSTLMLIT